MDDNPTALFAAFTILAISFAAGFGFGWLTAWL